MEINFVTAKNGKVELMADKTVVASSEDASVLANFMYDHGMADSVTPAQWASLVTLGSYSTTLSRSTTGLLTE